VVLTDAQATLEAARITAEATRWAGWISGLFSLLVGGVAVAGAVFVGIRQTKILALQTEIDHKNLKFSLLDRRVDTREKIQTFCNHLIAHAKMPDPNIFFDYLVAKSMSKLLFNQNINDNLEIFSKKTNELFSLQTKMKQISKINFHYDEEDTAKERDLLQEIYESIKFIDKLFVDEMRVGW
jgi:hypothetical protein